MAEREGRKASWHGKAFLVEALVLLVFLVASLSILVSLFVQARTEGAAGERLSRAVQLAQNTAEAFAADPAAAQDLVMEDDGLVASVRVEGEPHESGWLLDATVTVVDRDGSSAFSAGEEAYRLETARYVPGSADDVAWAAGGSDTAANAAADVPASSGDESGVE